MMCIMIKGMFAVTFWTFTMMSSVQGQAIFPRVPDHLHVNMMQSYGNALESSPQHNRIIGGERVRRRTDVPYQVSLRFNNQHICGGTIYKPRYVITAAHCVNNNDPSNLQVVAGDLNLRHPTSMTQASNVDKIIINPYYSNVVFNDIALLRLKTPFRFNEYVNAVPIFNHTFHRRGPLERCLVSGWGALHYQGELSPDLHATFIQIFNPVNCQQIHGANFKPKMMLCAGDSSISKDACNGDSGGPLICNGALYGIVSWGIGCGVRSLPGVYTNASHYSTWLNRIASKSSSLSCNISLLSLLSLVVALQIFE